MVIIMRKDNATIQASKDLAAELELQGYEAVKPVKKEEPDKEPVEDKKEEVKKTK